MTQEFKSIEEIKEEVAKESGKDTFDEMVSNRLNSRYSFYLITSLFDQIAQRYAQQYANEVESLNDILNIRQSRIIALEQSNKELVEMLEELLPLAEDGYKLHKSNGCHQDFLEDDRETLKKAKSLITKHKQP